MQEPVAGTSGPRRGEGQPPRTRRPRAERPDRTSLPAGRRRLRDPVQLRPGPHIDKTTRTASLRSPSPSLLGRGALLILERDAPGPGSGGIPSSRSTTGLTPPGRGPLGSARVQEILLYLPCRSGTLAAREGFAADCLLRQPVCGCRDFAAASRDHPRHSRAFAGSWERGTAESEPETASSGSIAGT
jgi:hypothetical protein